MLRDSVFKSSAEILVYPKPEVHIHLNLRNMGLVEECSRHRLVLDEVLLPLCQVVDDFVLCLQSVGGDIAWPVPSNSSFYIVTYENFTTQLGPLPVLEMF